VACVKVLLAHGAGVNSTTADGCTALYAAVSKGQAGCAELILQSGANVNSTTNDGWSALCCAARYGYTACVEMLLEHNANTEKCIQSKTFRTAPSILLVAPNY